VAPRQLAGAGVAALAVGLVAPPLALAVLVWPWARRHLADRRLRSARLRDLSTALPETVDLLLLCTGAGLSLPLALPLVADRAPEPVGAALRAAQVAADAGSGRADALVAHLAPLGDPAAALAHVLVDHLRYGEALGPGLERAALELRLARRRRAEEEARRLPVRLLAPLLTCVLPAFVLLTVVPLLVAALRSLPR
jgi:Flp pilus assembly protein TadB